MSYLRCLCIVVSNTYCVVFLFAFLPLLYPMLPVSLDCPFLIALRYSLTFMNRVRQLWLATEHKWSTSNRQHCLWNVLNNHTCKCWSNKSVSMHKQDWCVKDFFTEISFPMYTVYISLQYIFKACFCWVSFFSILRLSSCFCFSLLESGCMSKPNQYARTTWPNGVQYRKSLTVYNV